MIEELKEIELELSSLCNAKCPGCRRTIMDNRGEAYPKLNIDTDKLLEQFEEYDLSGLTLKICGVLGDPILHPKLYEITDWLIDRNARVKISTNGSLYDDDYWHKLGLLSKNSSSLYTNFAVDGLFDTNKVYRVNTNYETIENNMRAYRNAGGEGAWVFIEFDHNSHQIEQARKLAESIGLEFYVKRAAKNDIFDWFQEKGFSLKKKPSDSSKTAKPHDEKDSFEKIIKNDDYIYDSNTIHCKFIHGKEAYIAANGTVWPCCYLWDEFVKGKTILHDHIELISTNKNWNSIYHYSLNDILKSEFYEQLSDIWFKNNQFFQKRCFSSCGKNGKLRNSVSRS